MFYLFTEQFKEGPYFFYKLSFIEKLNIWFFGAHNYDSIVFSPWAFFFFL